MSKMDYKTFLVTEKDNGIRPAGRPDSCFYCGSIIGQLHKLGCVITWKHKKVKLIAVVDFEEEVPEHWNNKDIMSRYNDSTWCASNLIDDDDCACTRTRVYFTNEVYTLNDDHPQSTKQEEVE